MKMAFLVALNFSPPPILASHKGIQQERTGQCAMCVRHTRATFNTIAPVCISKYITIPRLDSRCHIGVAPRDLSILASFLSDVSYSCRTLTGYWVGPDTEDGWGFVEALVYEIM